MNMFPENSLAWGRSKNCIREITAYGVIRKQEIGAENVYDFSLGNPSIPVPDCVNEEIAKLACEGIKTLHGYTTAAGNVSLRAKIADDLNKRFSLNLKPENLYVTCGAASALMISLKAIILPGEEVLTPVPYFTEYSVFTKSAGAVFVPVAPGENMQMNLEGIKAALTDKTKAIIINSPNNPSGVIYKEENMKGLADILNEHRKKTGNIVYIISDEPYRELVYSMDKAPAPAEYYDNTIICYSWSKSMSIPGERIGYVAISDRAEELKDLIPAVAGAGRGMGYINPPSLFQNVIERCYGATSDLEQYKVNRDLLAEGLREIGYEFLEPDGAFYLFVKALEPDAKAFAERAKKHELLVVPSNDFGCTGYVRIAYCVSPDMIKKSMPAFKALFEEYK